MCFFHSSSAAAFLVWCLAACVSIDGVGGGILEEEHCEPAQNDHGDSNDDGRRRIQGPLSAESVQPSKLLLFELLGVIRRPKASEGNPTNLVLAEGLLGHEYLVEGDRVSTMKKLEPCHRNEFPIDEDVHVPVARLTGLGKDGNVFVLPRDASVVRVLLLVSLDMVVLVLMVAGYTFSRDDVNGWNAAIVVFENVRFTMWVVENEVLAL